jgi:hypothetical protein
VELNRRGPKRRTNRRDTNRRAEVVRTVLEEIVHGAAPVITVESLRDSLHVSPEAALRIVDVSAPVCSSNPDGVWTGSPLNFPSGLVFRTLPIERAWDSSSLVVFL